MGFHGDRKRFLPPASPPSHCDLRFETGVLQLNKGHYHIYLTLSLLLKRGMMHDYIKSDYLRGKMTKAASCILIRVPASGSPHKENKIKALRDIVSFLSSYVLPLISGHTSSFVLHARRDFTALDSLMFYSPI